MSPALRNHSFEGLRLDGIVNETILNLKYLCETINGVPLNELAVYVSQNIRKKGGKKFRDELKLYGKSEEEIEIWLKFAKSAQQNLTRTLNLNSILKTISDAADFIKKYISLSLRPNREALLFLHTDTKDLIGEIKLFFSGDPNMAIAIRENTQIPYWDVNENYGGS